MDDPKRFVRDAFASIAHRYDRLNTVLSLGVDRCWRRRAVRLLDPRPGERILDLCAGTLTFSRAVHRAARGRVEVTAVDFCMEMLTLGRARLSADEAAAIRPAAGDAECLPLRDERFDAALVTYGIRNLTRPGAALRELARVLRPGGRVVILDFLRPRGKAAAALYGFYLHRVLPRAGGLLSGSPAAYRHLADSIRRFMEPEALLDLLARAGFKAPRLERYTGSIAGAFSARKPGPSSPPPGGAP